MQVNPNYNLGGPSPVGAKPAAAARPAAEMDEAAAFGDTAALNESLAASPDVRADQVARARELIADTHYPPPEGIKKIAQLLALNLESDKSSQ